MTEKVENPNEWLWYSINQDYQKKFLEMTLAFIPTVTYKTKYVKDDNRWRIIKIDGCIDTNLTHDEWLDQFILWLESRNERFGGGGTKGCVSSRKKSVFSEEFQNIIKEEVEKGKYNPDEDPFLIEHKRKTRKILGQRWLILKPITRIGCVNMTDEGKQELVDPKIFVDLPEDLDDENDEFGRWNYRVVKHGEQYKIVEVFYNKYGDISGWADTSDTNLTRENFAELKDTYDSIRYAFEKPVLIVVSGDRLVMVDEISD